MKIQRFEEIQAWQFAPELTRKIYELTQKTGFSKDNGLKQQIRYAAGASMPGIAEGFDAESHAAFIRFFVRRETIWYGSPV